jgi:DNA ligase D-like protein (predicted 3'-phosphoesterase)
MTGKDPLKNYKAKRNFEKTPEPSSNEKIGNNKPRFVIQKHDARKLHYDFRIEVEGVLKSWAIPKGPSPDPSKKRLAIPTEDHPLDYIYFEGVIPQGNYGAGTVMVWDTGTYRNLKKKGVKTVPMEETIEDGHVDIWLEGEKLKGGYVLIRTGRKDRKFWLFFKMKDNEADPHRNPLIDRPESVLSGLTIEEIENNQKKMNKSK